MKVMALTTFKDLVNDKKRVRGEVFSCTQKRAKELEALNFVEEVKEDKKGTETE